MRITKRKLSSDNSRLKFVVFIEYCIICILLIILSFNLLDVKKSNDDILKNTNEIIGILTIGEENGD